MTGSSLSGNIKVRQQFDHGRSVASFLIQKTLRLITQERPYWVVHMHPSHLFEPKGIYKCAWIETYGVIVYNLPGSVGFLVVLIPVNAFTIH